MRARSKILKLPGDQVLLTLAPKADAGPLSQNVCGRCGDEVVVLPAPPKQDGSFDPAGIAFCSTCRVDRVKRWADLFAASASEGNELRTDTHQPSARLLTAAGLIHYNSDDGAWELSEAGLALLLRFDASKVAP